MWSWRESKIVKMMTTINIERCMALREIAGDLVGVAIEI
jgi:hypothetical protein